MDKLHVGDVPFMFKLKNQFGNDVDLRSVIASHDATVVFFYPKDGSPGCTREGCSFEKNIGTFKQCNAAVLGISSDKVVSHRDFANKNRLTYDILSDHDGDVRAKWGLSNTLLKKIVPSRVTFVLDRNGVIRDIYTSMFMPRKHVEHALETVRRMRRETE